MSVYSTIAVDDFTARLFKIHQQILKEGRSQVRQHSRDDTGVRGSSGGRVCQLEGWRIDYPVCPDSSFLRQDAEPRVTPSASSVCEVRQGGLDAFVWLGE